MSNIEKISVSLTSEQVEALNSAVESGEYETTSEVVREAILDWQLKRRLSEKDITRLGQLWDEGVASGSAGEVDFPALRAEARKRLQGTKSTR